MTFSDAVRVLFEIEFGKVTVTPREHPDAIFAGNVTYDCSNGWVVVIFNDCNSFDYVDSIIEPGGCRYEFEDFDFLGQYSPPETVVKGIYRFGERE